MLFGMLIGLASGTALGAAYQGSLLTSTLYAILLGSAAGAAVAISFGMAAIVEGFASGLMGGMMGAMLGEMVAPSESVKLINLLLVLSSSSLLLFAVLPSRSEIEASIPSKLWFLKPMFTFILISGFLIGGSQAVKYLGDKQEPGHMEEKQEKHNH